MPASQLLPRPPSLSLVEAAALPEVACTVWSMAFGDARLQPGEAFLVRGLPGGRWVAEPVESGDHSAVSDLLRETHCFGVEEG